MKTATKAVTAKSVGRGRQSRDPGAKAAAAPKTKGRAPVRAVGAKRTAPEPSPSAAPARRSKKAAVIALLQRPEGAAIGDLTDATGWQVHSVRAALTGLRNEGKDLVRDKDTAGVTRYRLAALA